MECRDHRPDARGSDQETVSRGVRMEDLLGEDGDQDRILKPEPTHHPEEHEQVAKRRLAAHVVEAGEKTREHGCLWLGGSTGAVETHGEEGRGAPPATRARPGRGGTPPPPPPPAPPR